MTIDLKTDDVNIVRIIDQQLVLKGMNNDRDYSHFHPSEWAECKRKIGYAYHESQGVIKVESSALDVDPQLERIFDNGHYTHDRWSSYMERTGALMGLWECENIDNHTEGSKIYGTDSKLGVLRPEACECGCTRFRYIEVGFNDPETLWAGHVDSIVDLSLINHGNSYGLSADVPVEDRCVVIDYKTMNPFQFEKLNEPTSKHYTQMQIYLYLSGLNAGLFIYENKGNQSVKEFDVKRNSNFLQKLKKEALELKYIVTHVNSAGVRILPDRPYKEEDKNNKECRQCKYRGHCWK